MSNSIFGTATQGLWSSVQSSASQPAPDTQRRLNAMKARDLVVKDNLHARLVGANGQQVATLHYAIGPDGQSYVIGGDLKIEPAPTYANPASHPGRNGDPAPRQEGTQPPAQTGHFIDTFV